jgi:hypothetical protein
LKILISKYLKNSKISLIKNVALFLMRTFITIALLFSISVVSAQDKKTDSLVLDFRPRYYNVPPCGCPTDGDRMNIQEYDNNSPYRYIERGPVVLLKPSDSLSAHWAELERTYPKAKKDTVPVL